MDASDAITTAHHESYGESESDLQVVVGEVSRATQWDVRDKIRLNVHCFETI